MCGSKLMVSHDPSIDYVLENQQVVRVNLDQPQQLQQTAGEWLLGAFERRNVQPVSMLQPGWELSICLEQWQKLLSQALTIQLASGS